MSTKKLTIKQLRAKFPDMTRNSNCLEDIACPNCGNRRRFEIKVTTMMEVLDDGCDSSGDVDWDDKSQTECSQCHREGKVRDFTFRGLDDALEDKQQQVQSAIENDL